MRASLAPRHGALGVVDGLTVSARGQARTRARSVAHRATGADKSEHTVSAAREAAQVAVHDSLDAAGDSLDGEEASTSGRGKLIGSTVTAGGVVLLIAGGAYFQEPIAHFVQYFSTVVDDMGPPGVLLYMLVYAALEILAVPAIPLTMTAGAIFGIVPGSIIVSLAGAGAATVAFLIARYVARDRFLPWAEQNKQFRAVNRVVERDGFKVVTLLRLSPLLPLAISNYFYGLTSVGLADYFFGSWLGMFPGTVAYVSAGHVSKVAVLGGDGIPLEWWQVALAGGVTVAVIGYIGNEAKKAIEELDREDAASRRAARREAPPREH